jgi:hypothetical protein
MIEEHAVLFAPLTAGFPVGCNEQGTAPAELADAKPSSSKFAHLKEATPGRWRSA